MNDTVNYSEIINRIKSIECLRHNKDVAAIWDLSETDFSNRKRRGTLLSLLVNYGINKGLDLNWLITGRQSATQVNNDAGESLTCQLSPDAQEAFRSIRRILESGDKATIRTLRMHITTFEKSFEMYQDNLTLKNDIALLKVEIDKLKRQQDPKRHTGTG